MQNIQTVRYGTKILIQFYEMPLNCGAIMLHDIKIKFNSVKEKQHITKILKSIIFCIYCGDNYNWDEEELLYSLIVLPKTRKELSKKTIEVIELVGFKRSAKIGFYYLKYNNFKRKDRYKVLSNGYTNINLICGKSNDVSLSKNHSYKIHDILVGKSNSLKMIDQGKYIFLFGFNVLYSVETKNIFKSTKKMLYGTISSEQTDERKTLEKLGFKIDYSSRVKNINSGNFISLIYRK